MKKKKFQKIRKIREDRVGKRTIKIKTVEDFIRIFGGRT